MEPYNQDNIVALATPVGTGALAVIRISGQNLSKVYRQFTNKTPKNRHAQFSKIYHPINGTILDEGIIVFFKSPNSYTGEDVIEISCHGGSAISESLISAANDIGIRGANPGEFSLRSFLNGKIDLIQAEAISNLILSKSSNSKNVSLCHLNGKISNFFQSLKKDMIDLLSIIENELNFSENEIDFISKKQIKLNINKIKKDIQLVLKSSIIGKTLFAGIRVVIFGKTNSGKSSLFNALLGQERAIISDEEGTTRDSIEHSFEIKGSPILLIDTAGIWSSKKNLDMLGVKNTINELKRADICIVVDSQNPKKIVDDQFYKYFNKNIIYVKSKSDIYENKNKDDEIISTSAITRRGLPNLLTKISTIVVNKYSEVSHDKTMITKRQRKLIKESSAHLDSAINQLNSDLGMDIVASTLRNFIHTLAELSGEITNKDVINNIFNKFCVGK